jgi:hypothetical protein
MKSYLQYLLCIFILFSGNNCSKKDTFDSQSELNSRKTQEVITRANTICGSANPEQSLQWLKEIITKAEEDRLTKKYGGNYMGEIRSTSYNNQPVFYIRMLLGSGGIYAYIYDCNGKTVTISTDDMVEFEQNAQQGQLVYSNKP